MSRFSALKSLIKSNRGRWGSWQHCEVGEYVKAMWVKAEKHQKDGDDSAVNGIRLQCSDGKNLNSAEGAKGEWSQLFKYRTEGMYEEGYDPYKPYQDEIVSVYVRSMPPCTGNCDNEGVSGLRFKHLDGRYYQSPDGSQYCTLGHSKWDTRCEFLSYNANGIWGSANCPAGTAVNGFRTKAEEG